MRRNLLGLLLLLWLWLSLLLCACGANVHRSTLPGTPGALPGLHALVAHGEASWVALGESQPEPADLAWTDRAPNSYLRFATAPAPALERPVTIALTGSGPPCVVRSAETLYLRTNVSLLHRQAPSREVFRVLEVPRATCPGRYVVAVAGAADDARAHARNGTPRASRETTAWTERHVGVRLADEAPEVNREPSPDTRAAYLESVPGTDVDAVHAHFAVEAPPPDPSASDGERYLQRLRARVNAIPGLLLRREGRLLAHLGDVDLVGHLRWSGRDYVVVRDTQRLWAFRIN